MTRTFLLGPMAALALVLAAVPGAAQTAAGAATEASAPAWQDFASGTVEANGVRLAYREAGQGTPIVLVHGWLGTSHTWRGVAPLLAANHRVVVLDMRGNGASDKPDAGYDGRTMARDLRAVVGELGLERPVIVGHDMGAPPVLLLGARHPEELAGIGYLDEPLLGVNLDGFTDFRPELGGGFWWFGFNATPGLAETLIVGREREWLEAMLSGMVVRPGAVTPADIDTYLETFRGREGVAGSVGWYREAFATGEQVAAALASPLEVPVLALGGEMGVASTHEQLKPYAPRLSGGVVANAGHNLPEDAPEEVARHIAEFAASLDR